MSNMMIESCCVRNRDLDLMVEVKFNRLIISTVKPPPTPTAYEILFNTEDSTAKVQVIIALAFIFYQCRTISCRFQSIFLLISYLYNLYTEH